MDKEGLLSGLLSIFHRDKEGFLLVNIGGLPMGFLQSLH